MNILFRVDSSLTIGAGHLMRCLALAEALSSKEGVRIAFISRKHVGHLNALVQEKGFQLFELEVSKFNHKNNSGRYSDWLGAPWEEDAKEVTAILASYNADVLIVDHYAIGEQWERQVTFGTMRLVVIDDLANRSHVCNMLIDQTCHRREHEYAPYVDESCKCLLGSAYAMLRPEFLALRSRSLTKRKSVVYGRILVSLGAVDQGNITAEVLNGLSRCSLPANTEVTVVLGRNAPHIDVVLHLAETASYSVQVLTDVSNMGQLMIESDFAIGAAGSSAWERCCLGLPTIMVVSAENQMTVAENLANQGAAILLEKPIGESLVQLFSENIEQRLSEVAKKSAQLVDGKGCERIIKELELETAYD